MGSYELLDEVGGHGGVAVVYLAAEPPSGGRVALKQVDLRGRPPELLEGFVRDSQDALRHPGIVALHAYLEHDGRPYVAMEYVEGGSLRERIGDLALSQVAGVLEAVLAALAHAHAHGIVHGDVKPENVLVTAGGAVKLGDFGAYANGPGGLTATGLATGALAYMAPEQVMGGQVGPWTDLYSTGVVAFELLLGRLPFEAATVGAMLAAHAERRAPELDPSLDRDLAGWLERMLAAQPSERPEGAAAAWEAFEAATARIAGPGWRRETALPPPRTPVPDEEEPAPRPVAQPDRRPLAPPPPEPFPWTPPPPPRRRRRRRPRLRLILPALALVAVTGAVIAAIVLHRGPPPTPGLTARIDLSQWPDSLAAGEEGVWAIDANGDVLRFDPASKRVANRLHMELTGSHDIAVGEGGVWASGITAAGLGELVRIDPRTRRPGKPLELGRAPAAVAAGEGAVWVADYIEDNVTRVDPRTGRVVATIKAGSMASDVAVGEGAVWVANQFDDSVTRIDPKTNRTVGRPIKAGKDPLKLAAGAGGVWVLSLEADTLTRIDPDENRAVGRPLRVPNASEVAVGRGWVWVTANPGNRSGTIRAVDPRTNTFAALPIAVADAVTGLALDPDAVWIGDLSHNALLRLSY